jgi:hypothetical protein
MNKKLFAVALTLLAFASFNARQANAQSCPTSSLEVYGERAARPVDKSLQSQIEITYFTTSDPSAFISERAGLKRSATSVNIETTQFVARLGKLEREGLASIRKQQAVTSFLGQLAQLNLERESSRGQARIVKAGASSTDYLAKLDRETEVSVYRKSDSEYYRVSLVSWFVNMSFGGGQRVADYDADILLKPGETAIFKLASDQELARSGNAGRSYMAVTMRSVNGTGPASMAHARVARKSAGSR